jgi:phosphatidylserine/phosphatidylglycerophosphate/cardiolipin synthase-like enzyme
VLQLELAALASHITPGRDLIVTLDPTQWLLTPAGAPGTRDGKPWGTGTKMADRAINSSTPWDVGCKVTTIVGGFAAMTAMCEALETVISNAEVSTRAPGDRGHVYIAGWRFNCQRDLSSANSWKTGAWSTGNTAADDQTALGLILRLLQAGVVVRVLVWFPTFIEDLAAHLTAHVKDHTYLWRVVKAENERLVALHNLSSPIGIVGLDKRVASGAISGAHHQKMLVIRSPWLDVAFCGGVDLAFSRRDSPANPGAFTPEHVFDGDWQSGNTIPKPSGSPGLWWPRDATTDYTSVASVPAWAASDQQGSDLPTNTNDPDVCTAIGGTPSGGTCVDAKGSAIPVKPIYDTAAQYWHDQHLQLEGPIVSTLEWQFAERWIDAPNFDLPGVRLLETVFGTGPFRLTGNAGMGAVAFSTPAAYNIPGNGSLRDLLTTPTSTIKKLDDPVAITSSPGASIVQMWRTIPMRQRSADPFLDGEFTIMEGISKAIGRANELIWMFDQFFWSEPLTRQLNARLKTVSTLCVLIVLPPHADAAYDVEHRARHFALEALFDGLTPAQRARVAVYDMWRPSAHDRSKGRGIYVHAKAHTYDGSMLVCGSANLNRRSFTCDSELSCAVLDAAVVAGHQQKLWNMLFAEVSGPSAVCPTLDLDQTGSGTQFLAKFAAAAASNDAFVIPDPWDDDNPLKTTPVPVALPNGVPRPALIAGPLYEIKGRIALDAGSLQPTVEDDVVQPNGVPRPAALDDIVTRIESGKPKYPQRKAAGLLTGQVFHMPAIVFAEAGFHYTDQQQWWKEVCIGLPCFVELGWLGYESGVIDHIEANGQSMPLQIDGHDIVIQIWRGWCERFLDMKGMPGGVGVEIGVYRKIPGQLDKFLKQVGDIAKLRDSISRLFGKHLPKRFQVYFDKFATNLAQYGSQFDQHIFWPFPELDARIEFTFTNPTNNKVLLHAKPSNTYWRVKWIDLAEYKDLALHSADHPINPLKTWDYTVDFTITGKTNSYHHVWPTYELSSTQTQSFPPHVTIP